MPLWLEAGNELLPAHGHYTAGMSIDWLAVQPLLAAHGLAGSSITTSTVPVLALWQPSPSRSAFHFISHRLRLHAVALSDCHCRACRKIG